MRIEFNGFGFFLVSIIVGLLRTKLDFGRLISIIYAGCCARNLNA